MQTTPSIAALVPRRLWSNDHGHGVRVCRGAILFADIAGFTRLTENARRKAGTRGIELLTTQINSIFGDLVEAAHRSGGDILKFGGDAILVAYDATESEQDSVSFAIAGACAMERAMKRHRRTTLRTLSLHLGLAHGEWREYVAGVAGVRREHFVWGSAIARAMHAADSGNRAPQIDCVQKLLPRPSGSLRIDRNGRSIHQFTGTPSTLLSITRNSDPTMPDAAPLWDFVAEDLRDDSKISTFRPEQSAEHRHVSALFGFWACPSALADSRQSTGLIERIFHAAQGAARQHNGLWARSDPSGDKQKLLILFGASQSGPDDTDHALAAARSLQAEFAEIKREHSSLRLGIGVATATVFAGFVGHAERREFTAMGDGVNLAARLAAKSKRNTILVDSNTRAESTRFQFRGSGTLTLKNVRKPTTVWIPYAEVDAAIDSVRDDLVEHPQAMTECIRLWNGGATCIRLEISPGTNSGKFIAQFLSRPEVGESDNCTIVFDNADALNPLGGIRRICTALIPDMSDDTIQQQRTSLEEMLNGNGHWTTRALARLGPEAAALAVVREISRRQLPQITVVLENPEVLGEFDRRVLAGLAANRGTHWLWICHSEATSSPPQHIGPLVRLGAVGRNELAQVIGNLLFPARPSKSLLDFLFERSHGMPRLASSLTSHLIAHGAASRTSGRNSVWHLRSTENLDLPNSLRAQYLQRVDRLPQTDRQVLRAVAVLGENVPLEAVKRLCSEVSQAELLGSMTQLQEHRLLTLRATGNETRISFDDETCRQAVYDTMSHQLRESWHKEAAAYWLAASRTNASQVGEHLFRARDPRSARWLTRAARQARRYWSLDLSLRFTRWAILAMHGRCEPEYRPICPPFDGQLSKMHEDLYNDLSSILQLQGKNGESARVERWLVQLAMARGDRQLACRHRLSIGRIELLAGRYMHSQSQAKNVLSQSRQPKNGLIRAQATYLLGETYRRSGRVDRSLRALEEAESLAHHGGHATLHADVLNALGLLHWNCGRLEEARRCFENSLRHLPRQGDHARRGQVANNLGILTEEQGRLRVAERFYQKAFIVFDRTGVRRNRAYSLGNLANLHRHGARYERARAAYEEVETELRAMGEAHAAAYTVGNIGDLECDFGDWESARQRYEATLEFARKSGDEELKAECYGRIAHLYLISGRLDLMPRMLANSRKAALRAESREFALYAQLLTTEMDIAKGHFRVARIRIKKIETVASAVGLVYYQLWTMHVSARLTFAEGDPRLASTLCLAGMERARSTGYRWWELRFATLGANKLTHVGPRKRCVQRCASLVRDIEMGIGDEAVRDRFVNLDTIREALACANSLTADTPSIRL